MLFFNYNLKFFNLWKVFVFILTVISSMISRSDFTNYDDIIQFILKLSVITLVSTRKTHLIWIKRSQYNGEIHSLVVTLLSQNLLVNQI